MDSVEKAVEFGDELEITGQTVTLSAYTRDRIGMHSPGRGHSQPCQVREETCSGVLPLPIGLERFLAALHH